MLDPPCPHFDILWQRFAQLQQMLGGDALIGKKLLPLLSTAGFRNIRLSIQPEVHFAGTETFGPWIDKFMGNILSGERQLLGRGLASAEEIRKGLEDLRRLKDDRRGSAFFYWNRARGVK